MGSEQATFVLQVPGVSILILGTDNNGDEDLGFERNATPSPDSIMGIEVWKRSMFSRKDHGPHQQKPN